MIHPGVCTVGIFIFNLSGLDIFLVFETAVRPTFYYFISGFMELDQGEKLNIF